MGRLLEWVRVTAVALCALAAAAGAAAAEVPKGASAAECAAQARAIVEALKAWSSGGNQAIHDKPAFWNSLMPTLPPLGRLAWLVNYLGQEDGAIKPLRTNKEKQLYDAMKAFARDQPSAKLDFQRTFTLALEASKDASGRANIFTAMLTAHNVVRIVARPEQWRAEPGEEYYGHPSPDPINDIIADMGKMEPGTLPDIMRNRGVFVPARDGKVNTLDFSQLIFSADKGFFQTARGARLPSWNGGSHYYFWIGALGRALLGTGSIAYGAWAELRNKQASNAEEQGIIELTHFVCGGVSSSHLDAASGAFKPGAPLEITAISGAGVAVNNGPRTDTAVYWTGGAVPPLRVVTYPVSCPAGGCLTLTYDFPAAVNPLVLNNNEFCYGYAETFRMRYETVVSDASGRASPPYLTEGECLVPEPCPDLPPGDSATPGGMCATVPNDVDGPAPDQGPPMPIALDADTTPPPSLSYTVTHFAGAPGGPGVSAGSGNTARFHGPAGIATDGKGTIVVADAVASTIRKISADGVVSAFVGQPGVGGAADGAGDFAQFDTPLGVAIDAAGNVWVADTGNHTIRRINTASISWTFAGAAGQAGTTDATGNAARFRRPAGIAAGPSGIIYVADTGSHTIRKITPEREVTTLAGKAGEAGSADGGGGAARFSSPTGLAVDGEGNLWVADTENHLVRKVTSAGVVSTIAGQAGVPGAADGVGSAATFSWPMGIAADATGVLYVTDTYDHTVRRVGPDGRVVTLAGSAGVPGSADGIADRARFSLPLGIALDASGVLYVADGANNAIRAATLDGIVTTLAGRAAGRGWLDGIATETLFASPVGIGMDATGNLLVADADNHVIRKVTPSGIVTTFAGTPGEPGSTDGTGAAARFNRPTGLAVDGAGNVFVADSLSHTIRQVTPAGVVSTLAGSPATPGTSDGARSSARFNQPWGLTLDGAGALYVADAGNHAIRKLSPAGVVSTLAGKPGESGTDDGTGQAARFAFPHGVAVDGSGSVFVADTGNLTIRRITPAGAVTTIAGLAGEQGLADGYATRARFLSPEALAVDASGYLWIADAHRLRRLDPGGTEIFALVGGILLPGTDDGVSGSARFQGIGGLALGGNAIYVADTGNDCIRRAALTEAVIPAVRSVTPAAGAMGGGTRITVTGVNFTASGMYVKLGGKSLTDIQVVNTWTLTGRVPAATTGARDLEVITFGGRAFAPRAFTYTPYTAYLAEGATIAPFTMELAMLNPGATRATGTVRFSKRDGTTVNWGLDVPPHTRVTWWPGEKTGARDAEFSTLVESDQPLVVDRTMSWDASGYGSHAETGVEAPALTWYLAEGATHSGFDLFYLVQNPSATDADIEVSFLLPSGPPLVRNYTVQATSRFNIWVDLIPELANTDVSAVIKSTNKIPVIVERAMYLTGRERLFDAGHESAGVTTPAAEWFLAEGATGPYFDLFILVANPSDRDADIEAQYLLPDGTTLTKRYVVAARSRFNIWADLEEIPAGSGRYPLADTAVSTRIASLNGVWVVVERAMWWPRQASEWQEAHNSPGATQTGTKWAMAAGEVSSDARAVETFILMANTSSYPGEAVLTLMFEDGTTAQRHYGLPASSRTNAWVNVDFPEAAGRRFGAVVESVVPEGGTSPAEIVIERAMYSNAGGVAWAAGTNALATRLR